MSDNLVLISDTHLAAPAKSPVTETGANRRTLELVQTLDKALDLAYENKAEILHGGDFYHDRKGVRPEVLDAAGRWLERCRDRGVKVSILVGNHDLSDGSDGGTSIRALTGLARIVDTPSVLECGFGIRVAFLPYVHDPEEVRQTCLKLAKSSPDILLGHLGLGDPKYADAVPSDYEAPGRINLSDLLPEKFGHVFLGHYHNRQTLTKNAYYIGSPMQLSLKEAGQSRGLMLYKAGKVTMIENDWSPKYVRMSVGDAVEAIKSGTKNYVVATDADEAEAAEIVKLADSSGASVRVERTPPKAADSRMPSGTPENKIVAEYVKIVSKSLPPDEQAERVKLGNELLAAAAQESDDAH
jgi:DNA repair exonuclease SbcCD nuclease subunit